MTAKTAGQKFTASMVKNLGIGGRTRAYRNGLSLREDILDAVVNATTIPGYYSEQRTAEFQVAYASVNGYRANSGGNRVDAIVGWYLCEGLSIYQFVKMLGRMVDAGVTTSYQAEQFFRGLRAEANAAYSARY
jgi:hypothetical protein